MIGPVLAHGTETHATQEESPAAPALAITTPFDLDLGGAFVLTDQNGNTRSEVDPQGHMQLLFFGYANCQSICTVALPVMAQVTDDLAKELPITPVMITIDPARDTVTSIGPALQRHHSGFIGLTGSPAELQPVYDLFSIDQKLMFTDAAQGDVFAHGSHIYLLDSKGKFLTLFPPILSAQRIAEITRKYAKLMN